MGSSQQLLEKAAEDGTWDTDKWPVVLQDVLERLDKIVKTEFPIPILPPEAPRPSPIALASPLQAKSSQDSHASDKENAPAKARSPASRPPVPSFDAAKTSAEDDLPPNYPPELAALHKSIRRTLETGFVNYPPHTIQRLAELILWPKKHYRFLPSYLNALDRVVNVQSTTQVFPLPVASIPNANGMLNGASATAATTKTTPELGSDESLGGALLTPIPWLANRRDSQPSSGSSSGGTSNDKELQTSSTEMVEGPNGAGRIETVSVVNGSMTTVNTLAPQVSRQGQSTEEALRSEGAVTQGELLRQEQEAGVVPVHPRSMRLLDDDVNELKTSEGGDEELVHARGPEEIGDEDIGPQARPVGGALDLEAAVGRSRRGSSADPEDASLSEAGDMRDEDMQDADSADRGKSSAIDDDVVDMEEAKATGQGSK